MIHNTNHILIIPTMNKQKQQAKKISFEKCLSHAKNKVKFNRFDKIVNQNFVHSAHGLCSESTGCFKDGFAFVY